jgi:hypothetical protein
MTVTGGLAEFRCAKNLSEQRFGSSGVWLAKDAEFSAL